LYADDVQLYKKDNLATADGNALLKMEEERFPASDGHALGIDRGVDRWIVLK